MHRIDGPGATADKKFTDGDPANSVPATDVVAGWLNAVQEEMAGVIEEEGLELDKADSGQLSRVLKSRVVHVSTVADLSALNTTAFLDGQQVSVSGGGVYKFVAEKGTFVKASFSAPRGASLVGYRGGSVARELDAARAPLEVIAHAGFAGHAPPNTMLAMTTALERGADSLECDVQVSGDGTLYLFHDTTVDALTDGTGTFAELTDAYINGLRFAATAGTAFSDLTIPLFADFLAYAKRRGVRVYPEIKGYRSAVDIDLIVQTVTDAGMAELCTLQSFSISDLARVRELTESIAVGFLGLGTTGYEASIDALGEMRPAALLWNHSALTAVPAIVSYCRSAGIDIAAWSVSSSLDAKKLMDLGVMRIMSDITLKV